MTESGRSDLKRCSFQNVELITSETLGIGSYGKVCKAKCDSLVCAAKILHPTFFGTNDPGARMFVEKFEQECEFLRSVTHPNIVQCLGTFQDASGSQPLPVLLLELMDESLTHFLDRSKEHLSYFTEVTISHDVALALAFLHSNGYIHRDLSSNNILLIAGSRAKVADFGMCRLTDADAKMMTTCPGTVVYMPPEALREPPRYTDKIDTFSFGVVLVQILTRLFPNPGPSREVIDEVTERIVLETKRRENHIKLAKPNHPLLLIALDCLKNSDSQRATARDLCDRLDALKGSPLYVQSKNTKQNAADAKVQKKQNELNREFTKASLVREQQIMEKLDQTATKRENELKKEIDELRQQLKQHLGHHDTHQPNIEVSRPPRPTPLKRESATLQKKASPEMDQGDDELESPNLWSITSQARERVGSVEKESIDQWKIRKRLKKESSVPNLYEKWNIQPPTVRSPNTDRFSMTSQFIDFRSSNSEASGPSLDQVLSSRINEPPSVAQSSNGVSFQRRASSDDDLSDVNEYLQIKDTSSSAKQHDYYNIRRISKPKDHTYVNGRRRVLTPQLSVDNYEIPDDDPASPMYHKKKNADIKEPQYEPIPEAYVRSQSSPNPAQKKTSITEQEYEYIDDSAVRFIPPQSQNQQAHTYVNSGVTGEEEHKYENTDFSRRSEFTSLPLSPTPRPAPKPKPRRLPPPLPQSHYRPSLDSRPISPNHQRTL